MPLIEDREIELGSNVTVMKKSINVAFYGDWSLKEKWCLKDGSTTRWISAGTVLLI